MGMPFKSHFSHCRNTPLPHFIQKWREMAFAKIPLNIQLTLTTTSKGAMASHHSIILTHHVMHPLLYSLPNLLPAMISSPVLKVTTVSITKQLPTTSNLLTLRFTVTMNLDFP